MDKELIVKSKFYQQEDVVVVDDAQVSELSVSIVNIPHNKTSGTFTDEELEYLLRDNAVLRIKHGVAITLFYKYLQNLSTIIFRTLSIKTGNLYYYSTVTVTRSTKAWEKKLTEITVGKLPQTLLATGSMSATEQAYLKQVTFDITDVDLSKYQFFCIAFNGTFIITPFTNNDTYLSLGSTSVIVNDAGNWYPCGYRISKTQNTLTVYLKCADTGVVWNFTTYPQAYLYGVGY